MCSGKRPSKPKPQPLAPPPTDRPPDALDINQSSSEAVRRRRSGRQSLVIEMNLPSGTGLGGV